MTGGFAAFDVAAAAAIGICALYGFAKGMVRLVLGFGGLLLGWALALRFCEPVAQKLGAGKPGPSGELDMMRVVAFLIVFAAVVVLASLAAWGITRLMGAARLRGMDRLAGAGLGTLAAILLLCAATVPLVALAPPEGGRMLKESVLAPYAVAGGDYLKIVAPEPIRSRFTAASRSILGASLPG